MKKITVLILILFVPVFSFSQSQIVTFVKVHEEAPALENIFTEPFETLAIITNDGKAITVTNQLSNQVRGSVEDLESFLEGIDNNLDTVKLIVHNHPTPARWSLQDRRFYSRLKREGFKGDFALYFPWSKSIRYMEDTQSKRDSGGNPRRKEVRMK